MDYKGDHVIQFHTLQLQIQRGKIQLNILKDDKDFTQNVLSGLIGRKNTGLQKWNLEEHEVLLDFGDCHLQIIHFDIKHSKNTKITGHTYGFSWTPKTPKCKEFIDQYDMTGGHWYGASQVYRQTWPVEKWQRKLRPFLAGDSYMDEYGGVQERYWLSSNGIAIVVSPEIPLFVAMNDNNDKQLTFVSSFESPYLETGNDLSLKYWIVQGEDVASAHQLVYDTGMIDKPMGVPDHLMFQNPTWTTWARYKKDINQQSVISFAREIKENGFDVSQLEIDDDWTPNYGDMVFNKTKFQSAKDMVSQLTNLGIQTTLWVHPFCSLKSAAALRDFWVTGSNDGATKWWNGVGKCLDITNPEAVSWFKKSLTSLKDELGITSFKFDAGEICWLPYCYSFSENLTTPNDYATKWSEIAYDLDQTVRCQEVRVGVQSQRLPIFVRMMDKDSNWDYENGLLTLIPHCLTFGLIGYPFVLPDMIGGNAYNSFPERELFIRWLQVNIFMPALQFSICPWQYDQETAQITRDMTQLHKKYSQKIICLAEEATKTGNPINRPLWWIAPDDETAQMIDSEFLLGDDLLVAPVLVKGATSRDIYLPKGIWKDQVRGVCMEGGRWYKDYPAPLHVLPYFTLTGAKQEIHLSTEDQQIKSDFLNLMLSKDINMSPQNQELPGEIFEDPEKSAEEYVLELTIMKEKGEQKRKLDQRMQNLMDSFTKF